MKTSNIIIISTIGILVSLNLWMAIDAESKFESFVSEEEVTEEIEQINIPLENFSHIVVSGDINLNIRNDNNNSIFQYNENEYTTRIINDTLYVSGDSHLSLNCKSIKSIILKGDCKVNTEQLKMEYLLIKTFDNTKAFIKHADIVKLDIYSLDDSRIIMTQSKIDTTNVLATENSRIGLVGALSLVRGEIKDDSNLSVTGANSTQFSKSENGKVRMN